MYPLQMLAKCPLTKCPLTKCPLAKRPLAKCPLAICPDTVLNDSTPELTAGIKSGKGNVDGDLETENSTLYFRDGMIHFHKL